MKDCEYCAGTGTEPAAFEDTSWSGDSNCPQCEGTGKEVT